MPGRKNRHYYDKKSNSNVNTNTNNNNITQKEKNSYQNNNPRKITSLWDLIDSIVKEIYYIIVVIILKIYYDLKIDEFSHKGYLLFLGLDTIIAGGSIYSLINLLIKFYDLYSPFNQEWSYLYIWIICSLQILFFFTSLILFLTKYIYIKLFLVEKFKILFKILCIVIIIFNFLSLKDLNHDKYYFQIQNFEVKKLSHYKDYLQNHYVNLYLSKDYDVNEYELCFEMKYPENFSQLLKRELPNSQWVFTQKKDYFIGCRNISFQENPTIDKKQPLMFFKCDINGKNNVNTLPNYCISAEERRKKYRFIYKLNIFEFILLFLCFIYGYLTNYLFYKYHLYLSSEKFLEGQENREGEEEEGEEGEYEEDADGEDAECEEEEEDDDEEEEEEDEEVEENYNRRIKKYRKISKKKMKYYKKKQKNRFRKYHNNNITQTEANNINKEKEEKLLHSKEKEKKLIEEEKNEKEEKDINNKEIGDHEKYNNNINKSNSNQDNNREIKEKNIEGESEDDKVDKKEEKEYLKRNRELNQEELNNKNNMKKENDMNKEEFNNEEKHQSDVEMKPLRRKNFIYDFVLGGIVDRIKNKFYNILKEIDEDIKENEEN